MNVEAAPPGELETVSMLAILTLSSFLFFSAQKVFCGLDLLTEFVAFSWENFQPPRKNMVIMVAVGAEDFLEKPPLPTPEERNHSFGQRYTENTSTKL